MSGIVFALDVGETVDLQVPDNSYFPDTLRIRQFTCRAVTENAYFLVQDTSYIDLPDSSAIFQIIWDNLVGQAEMDSISSQFDGAGVDVYGSVTSLFGAVPQTVNDDDRIWVVFADIPDYYPVPGAPMFVRLQSLVCTWPEDFDGDFNTGNNHDAIYVNLGAYKNLPGEPWQLIRGSLHTWSVATGFGQFLRIANNRYEDRWVIRGLGLFAQFMCYGLTSEYNGRLGLRAYIRDFSRGGGIELSSWCSGQTGRDFGVNQGGEFLWFKYIEQRFGADVISEIVISPKAGMTGIANSIDPSVPDSIAEETTIYPLYEDWLITNLVAHIAGGYAGGIYRYNFLDGTEYTFTMINSPASFMGEFSTYPIGTWIANPYYGISAQTFAAQYADFQGDYSLTGDTTVYFNGMFNQNTGSGSNLNGRWTVYKIVLFDDSTLHSVDSLEFNEFYNGTFSLEGFRTCLVLTNNNPGGTARIRYVLSQDTAPKSLFLAALQNGINLHYLQVYTSLLREETQTPYGFDWAGPELELSKLNSDGSADSTAIIPMDFLSGTLWTGQAQAWIAGNYNLVCSGFDSLGVPHRDSLLLAVGYGGAGKLLLDIQTARLEIDAGILPQGAMASLVESNALGVSISSDLPLSSTGVFLSGFKTTPVALSFHQGLISFPAETAEGAIFRLDGEHWQKLNSYFLSGRMYSTVVGEGIYVFGDSPGLFSPEISTVPVFQGSSPNPFNSLVSFRFSIPQSGNVSLVVYDLSGRLVNTLASEQMLPGQHTVFWSGTNDSGIQIPSGVYFARLTATGFSETVKLVRVRGGI
ncbi:MAG: T9SS type A sorting domain-containing protein [Candidatus Sabulitectum sp.]|nr:T9SS type A sorting domain-containing protein [Candidatus Sabulitectum sp.]